MEIKVTSCRTCIFRRGWECVMAESISTNTMDKSREDPRLHPSECPLIKGEVTVKLELTQNPPSES